MRRAESSSKPRPALATAAATAQRQLSSVSADDDDGLAAEPEPPPSAQSTAAAAGDDDAPPPPPAFYSDAEHCLSPETPMAQTFVGTTSFMSPERLRGEVGHRSVARGHAAARKDRVALHHAARSIMMTTLKRGYDGNGRRDVRRVRVAGLGARWRVLRVCVAEGSRGGVTANERGTDRPRAARRGLLVPGGRLVARPHAAHVRARPLPDRPPRPRRRRAGPILAGRQSAVGAGSGGRQGGRCGRCAVRSLCGAVAAVRSLCCGRCGRCGRRAVSAAAVFVCELAAPHGNWKPIAARPTAL